MASTMRAIDIKNGKGPKENLFLNDSVPKPTPKQGEALVKIKAFGINRMDQIQREGNYPLPPGTTEILGVEFSGTIESVGPEGDVSDHGFKEGDAVFGLAYGGAYAEYIAVSRKMLLHKPDFLSWEQAAGIPETWITATQALHLVGGFQKGQRVLWHAGASGVSIAGIQLSLDSGASEVYATAGTAAKISFVTEKLGATKAFNYKEVDWAKEIKDATDSKGVDLIIDFIGGSYFSKNLDVAARDGKIVMLGMMGGGSIEEADIRPILFKRLKIEGSTLRSRDTEYQGRLRDKLEEYLPHFETGKLKVVIDTVLPWEEIQKAHELLETNSNSGKIICTIS